MQNFDWTSFTRKIAIKSNLETIYNAWTIPAEIEKWFLKSATYSYENGNEITKEQNVTAGNSYEWTWFLYDDIEHGKITEANGKDFFQFTFAGECLVDVKLSEESGYVIVEITQKNIPTDDKSKVNIRLGCDSGWSFYLVNLKAFYEHGVDLRNKDAKMKPFVNN